MHTIDKLAWIEIQHKKILSTRSRGKEKWYIPGGKREPGESDEAALIREVKEELDVALLPQNIHYYGTFSAQADGHPEGVMVKMQCYGGNYHGTLKASAEIAAFDWLDSRDLHRISPVDVIIFDWLKAQGLID
ncbi:MAG: NUDIX domain-containing protein [Bacteroidota bacterium]